MKKTNLKTFFKGICKGFEKNSPAILTGLGIAGMVASTALAIKSTPKAMKKIEEKKEELEVDTLPVTEVIKTTWKCYIPTIVTATTSTVCLIGASSVHSKRNAALATIYKMSETALIEYKEAVVETVGEETEKHISKRAFEKRAERNETAQPAYLIGSGDVLCKDSISGRYFKSSRNKIEKAQNYINRCLNNEHYASLNEFYEELGLSPTTFGRDTGWNRDDELLDVYFEACLSEDDVPCIEIVYNVPPKYHYDKLAY